MRAVKASWFLPHGTRGEESYREKARSTAAVGTSHVTLYERVEVRKVGWPGLPARATRGLGRPSLDARSEGQSGHPAEERIRKNDRTECSVNEPGGIAQFGKVECSRLFLSALGCKLDPNGAPKPRFKCDEHFKAELVPFTTHEVGHAGLCDAKALGRFCLGKFLLLDVEAKIAHEVGAQLKHGSLSRIKAEVNKNIAAGLVVFFFMTGQAGVSHQHSAIRSDSSLSTENCLLRADSFIG